MLLHTTYYITDENQMRYFYNYKPQLIRQIFLSLTANFQLCYVSK